MVLLQKILKIRNILFPITNFKSKVVHWNKITNLGKNTRIYASSFDGYNSLGNDVTIIQCHIGKGSYINHNSRLIGSRIGNYCSIADNVFTGFGHHPLNKISTHSAFFYDTKSQLGWGLFPQKSTRIQSI